MDKLDMLFIRACKSKNPVKRIRSVHRRFYYASKPSNFELARIIAQLADKYHPLPLDAFMNSVAEQRIVYQRDINASMLHVCINHFRFMDVTNLLQHGYVRPLKWRDLP